MTISLITGGNRGLGHEAARRLLELGHKVYLGARDEQRGRTAADELGAEFLLLDVTDDASVEAAAAELARREGHLDVLINNWRPPAATLARCCCNSGLANDKNGPAMLPGNNAT